MSWRMFARLKFSAIESSRADRLYAVSHGDYIDPPQSLSESVEEWQKAQWRRLSPSPTPCPVLSLRIPQSLWWMHAGPSPPHIHLTLLTQYKMWWSVLPHCCPPPHPPPRSRTAQLCCDLFPQPWKSKRAIKITGVWRPHAHRARSIMSLFYMAHFEAATASYAISEALIYWGANLCLALKLWACIGAS